MSKRKKFPPILHVIREEDDGIEDYFVAYTSGVSDLEENGTPVAIYRLVEVGSVNIVKSFKGA